MLDNNEYIDLLNDNLAMLRTKAGMTQEQLADAIGIPRTTYSAIENKKRKMTFPVFVNLSKFFRANDETAEILRFLGLSDEILNGFFHIKELIDKIPRRLDTRRAAAFGGKYTTDEEREKHRSLEKAIKEIDD